VSKLNALAALVIRSPILWGSAAAFGFFSLIHAGVVTNPLMVRYLAGHWVEYIEVVMFCIGISALVIKLADIFAQHNRLDPDVLGEIPDGGQPPEDAEQLVEMLDEDAAAESQLTMRLRAALDFVRRTGTADELEDHLKYLADLDAARAAQRHGLVRFVIWAIPIMGFLGTVIGITVAIANLSPTEMENITDVVAGLGTAFDTTATALGLSMVLMFTHFVVDRQEQSLLQEIDEATWQSLAGRFQSIDDDNGVASAVARLGEAVADSPTRLLEAQEEAWKRLETAPPGRLLEAAGDAGTRFSETLTSGVDTALAAWTARLLEASRDLGEGREGRWEAASASMAGALERFDDAVARLQRQQQMLLEQGEVLGRVVEATRDLASLERSLERNLDTLSSAGRFEETLATLSAAVQLLAARTSAPPARVELRGTDAASTGTSSGRAA